MRPVSKLLVVIATFVVLSACHAVAPVAPAPVPAGLVILHADAMHPSWDTDVGLSAYLVGSDGLYTNVTDKAQWAVSNPAILRDIEATLRTQGNNPASYGFAFGVAGTADVLASYQGFAAVMPVVAVPVSRRIGPVFLPYFGCACNGGFSPVGFIQVTHTLKLVAQDQSFHDVTAAASWVSSDPSVASVDHGLITGLNVGTTTVTAAFGGGTDSLTFSVYPSQGMR